MHILARKPASPFGHPTQLVSMQVQLVAILAIPFGLCFTCSLPFTNVQYSALVHVVKVKIQVTVSSGITDPSCKNTCKAYNIIGMIGSSGDYDES